MKPRTAAEAKLLEQLELVGHAWIVPAQRRLARRLQAAGLCRITDQHRPNPLRGSTETRVVKGGNDGR